MNWVTGEYGDRERRNSPGNNEDADSVGGDSEVLTDKDAAIEQKD